MKKLIALFTVAGFLTFGMANMAFAQNEQKTDNSAETEEVAAAEEAPAEQAVLLEDADETPQQGLHYVLKEKYIQGGALWMTPVLICLILGLALVIERIFYLNLASVILSCSLTFFVDDGFLFVVDAVSVVRFNRFDCFDRCGCLTDELSVDAFDDDFKRLR